MAAEDQDRVRVVEAMYEAVNAHDLTSINALIADDCVRHFARGTSPISGDHRGRNDVVATYAHIFELTADSYNQEIGAIMANENIVASFHQATGSRVSDGRTLDAEMLVRWKIEGGKVVEFWDYALDIPGLDQFLTP